MEEPYADLNEARAALSDTMSSSPHQGEEGRWEVMVEAGMESRPLTSYPEMEMPHVSKAEAEGILQSFNIHDGGAAPGTSGPGMEIRHISEAEAQDILQSFHLSIGGSLEAPPRL